jgi:hypothetical protein
LILLLPLGDFLVTSVSALTTGNTAQPRAVYAKTVTGSLFQIHLA